MTTALPRSVPSVTLPATRSDVPTRWVALRPCSLAVLLALCVTLLVDPLDGLFIFWRLRVPVLPLLFLAATGVWRNSCPVSAANQLPRVLGLTRGLAPPRSLRERGYVVAAALLATIIPTRRVVFDHGGPATAALLLGVVVSAFVGGAVFAGKSGWCSSICPMLPIERFYGQTPFAVVRNNQCQRCVGCAKHCYDATPTIAAGDDMRDPDAWWRRPRRLASLSRRWYTLHVTMFAAVAINGLYFLGLPSFMTAAERYTFHHHLDAAIWPVRAALATATLWWLARTIARDRARGVAPAVAVAIAPSAIACRRAASTSPISTSRSIHRSGRRDPRRSRSVGPAGGARRRGDRPRLVVVAATLAAASRVPDRPARDDATTRRPQAAHQPTSG